MDLRKRLREEVKFLEMDPHLYNINAVSTSSLPGKNFVERRVFSVLLDNIGYPIEKMFLVWSSRRQLHGSTMFLIERNI